MNEESIQRKKNFMVGNHSQKYCKDQLISKCLFGIFNSPKKQTKKFDFTTMVPQVELFSFVFWENWRHQKDISKLTDLYYFPSLVAGLALICTKKTGCVKFTSVLCNFLEPQCSCSAWHFLGFFFKKLAWITKYVAWNTMYSFLRT